MIARVALRWDIILLHCWHSGPVACRFLYFHFNSQSIFSFMLHYFESNFSKQVISYRFYVNLRPDPKLGDYKFNDKLFLTYYFSSNLIIQVINLTCLLSEEIRTVAIECFSFFIFILKNTFVFFSLIISIWEQ